MKIILSDKTSFRKQLVKIFEILPEEHKNGKYIIGIFTDKRRYLEFEGVDPTYESILSHLEYTERYHGVIKSICIDFKPAPELSPFLEDFMYD